MDATRPLGKDYRAWLRDNDAQVVAPIPLADMVKVAVEDTPFNNRKGTWPAIISNWLPYFFDNRQYRQGYAILGAALRFTNAGEDQKNWSTTLLNLSTNVRRTVFSKSLDLLVEAMTLDPTSKILLVENMQGMFGDLAWIDTAWFDKWPRSKTLPLLLHTGKLSDVSAALLQQWLKPKGEQQERLAQWLTAVREKEPETKHKLLELLPHIWKQQLYESNVGKVLMRALNDEELALFSESINKNVLTKAGSLIFKDLVAEWVSRPDTSVNWLEFWETPGTQLVSQLGLYLQTCFSDWSKIIKEKKLTPEQRQTLALAAVTKPQVIDSDIVKEVLKREGIPDGMPYLIESLDVTTWQEVIAMLEPLDENTIPDTDIEIHLN